MITKAQLNKLNFKQLSALHDRIGEMLESRQAEEKAAVKKQMAELAAESGFDLAELIGGKGKGGKRGKVAVKYRHPKDPDLAWTGRGRPPLWIVAEEKKGKKRDSFLVK